MNYHYEMIKDPDPIFTICFGCGMIIFMAFGVYKIKRMFDPKPEPESPA